MISAKYRNFRLLWKMHVTSIGILRDIQRVETFAGNLSLTFEVRKESLNESQAAVRN
jgi:hypothetical protein